MERSRLRIGAGKFQRVGHVAERLKVLIPINSMKFL